MSDTVTITVFGATCRCLGLKCLIEVKRAAGTPRDLEVVAKLEAFLKNVKVNPLLIAKRLRMSQCVGICEA